MAHFAEIGLDNRVIRVIVVNNNELLDSSNTQIEQKGIDFCNNLFGGTWIQTSYNSNFRKNFAAEGYIYDQDRDAFYEPQPFQAWTLNDDTCTWEAPIAYPEDDNMYIWDSDTNNWIAIE